MQRERDCCGYKHAEGAVQGFYNNTQHTAQGRLDLALINWDPLGAFPAHSLGSVMLTLCVLLLLDDANCIIQLQAPLHHKVVVKQTKHTLPVWHSHANPPTYATGTRKRQTFQYKTYCVWLSSVSDITVTTLTTFLTILRFLVPCSGMSSTPWHPGVKDGQRGTPLSFLFRLKESYYVRLWLSDPKHAYPQTIVGMEGSSPF